MMSKRRTRTAIMRQLLDEVEQCELCGSKRNLEAHHIIPVSVGGPDESDNLIVVCGSCHSKLTPKGVLTKMALQKRLRNGAAYIDFFRNVIELDCDTASDVLEFFPEWFLKYFPDMSYTTRDKEELFKMLEESE